VWANCDPVVNDPGNDWPNEPNCYWLLLLLLDIVLLKLIVTLTQWLTQLTQTQTDPDPSWQPVDPVIVDPVTRTDPVTQADQAQWPNWWPGLTQLSPDPEETPVSPIGSEPDPGQPNEPSHIDYSIIEGHLLLLLIVMTDIIVIIVIDWTVLLVLLKTLLLLKAVVIVEGHCVNCYWLLVGVVDNPVTGRRQIDWARRTGQAGRLTDPASPVLARPRPGPSWQAMTQDEGQTVTQLTDNDGDEGPVIVDVDEAQQLTQLNDPKPRLTQLMTDNWMTADPVTTNQLMAKKPSWWPIDSQWRTVEEAVEEARPSPDGQPSPARQEDWTRKGPVTQLTQAQPGPDNEGQLIDDPKAVLKRPNWPVDRWQPVGRTDSPVDSWWQAQTQAQWKDRPSPDGESPLLWTVDQPSPDSEPSPGPGPVDDPGNPDPIGQWTNDYWTQPANPGQLMTILWRNSIEPRRTQLMTDNEDNPVDSPDQTVDRASQTNGPDGPSWKPKPANDPVTIVVTQPVVVEWPSYW